MTKTKGVEQHDGLRQRRQPGDHPDDRTIENGTVVVEADGAVDEQRGEEREQCFQAQAGHVAQQQRVESAQEAGDGAPSSR